MKLNKLTDNLFLKVLSVLVAIVLWLAVVNISDAEGTETFYNMEVKLLNTDIINENGKVFRVEDSTNIVKLTVRARKSVLDELKQSDFTLTADMKKDLKYDSLVGINVQCSNRNINVDEDVTLNRRNVEVSIEDSATEQFPVHVKHTGEPSDGLVVGSLVPEQTVIKITGPVSIVERIKRVEALVDITGLPGNAVKTCSLNLYDAADGLMDTTYLNFVGKSDGIDVTVSMLNTKTVPLKFSYTGMPAENYEIKQISYKPETIDIAGNADVLQGISRLEIPAEVVNVEGIEEELQLVVDITQYLPSGVILENEDEASVLVTVEVEYVEPEEEEEDESEEESTTTKPSNTTTDKNEGTSTDKKPSNSEDTSANQKPSNDKETSTDKNPSDNQNNSSDEEDTDTGNSNENVTDPEGTGSTSDKEDTSVDDSNQQNQNNNGTESGANVKTESNS